jgi:hypothetical protein
MMVNHNTEKSYIFSISLDVDSQNGKDRITDAGQQKALINIWIDNNDCEFKHCYFS